MTAEIFAEKFFFGPDIQLVKKLRITGTDPSSRDGESRRGELREVLEYASFP